MHSGGDFVHIFVLEIIEISVERHENKLSRLFEAEVWKSMRLCALGRIFSVFYPYGFVHGVSVFHADVKWSCGKRQLLSGADVDITARILWNGRWDRGQGKSVRDTVLVSDDTAFSDVICGMQGGEACLLEPGFYGGWKRSVKRQLLCAVLLFHGVDRAVSERICCGLQEMRWRSRKSGLVFRRSICCAVSDPDRAVWRRGTGSDEISGGHDDEQGADYRGISEKDGCFYVQYAMLNSMVFYSGNLAAKVIRDCGGYLEGKKRMLPYLILLLLVYGVTVLFYRNQQFLDCVTFLLWKIGTPFVVGVPVLLCLTGERKKHKKKVRVLVLVCFLFGCLFLQGCNVAELEDKAFPVLLNIRDQDDFQNVWLNHEYAGNKEVDYNHLKVVLIERSFLEKEAEVEDMLSMLEQEKEVPWNAYVMTTESCDRLAQTEGKLDTLLGNYLEELLENTSGIDQKAYPTLGMLYEERANHLETLYIPFVDIEREQSGAVQDDTGKPQITAYEVWKRGRAAGLVDTDTARAAFFTQNFADDYTLQLAPELYVKVDAASCRVKETEKIGAGGLTEQIVTVTVTGEGEILSGTVSASEKEQLLNTRMEDYLNAIAAHALEKEIDITNSYRNLGADNRTWYFKYQNTPAAYEKDIKIQYLVKINWKSE